MYDNGYNYDTCNGSCSFSSGSITYLPGIQGPQPCNASCFYYDDLAASRIISVSEQEYLNGQKMQWFLNYTMNPAIAELQITFLDGEIAVTKIPYSL